MKIRVLFSAINYRMVLIVIETLVVYFFYDKFDFNLQIDFTILSIAIVFPLVFSITSAYQKRQDALSEFNSFRNKLIELSNLFHAVDGINKKNYSSFFKTLLSLQDNLISVLTDNSSNNMDHIRSKRKEIFYTLTQYKKLYNEREKDSIIRVKNELFESVEKLNTLKIHSTPISLRVYCLVFIYLSPLVYNSNILASFVNNNFLELVVSLFFSVIIGFILMALYNIQEYIEDPFDQQGLDDLKFDKMLVGKNEILE
ncbi:MAG: hypothetical protein CBD72_02705 [Flavobacteriaceae bacterium TMED212]|nr:MAG: hypothetical protein CBD72_02705 [Flavobacteriaceae bacterium TMED212]|tara:strand:+ start:2684 stop:3451 length:768 start_codon:yes stop_codon:yes gene_type:complete